MRKLVVFSLGLLVAACGETPTETPTMDAAPVAMNFANGPAQAGIVYRGETPVGFLDEDPDTGNWILIGVTLAEACGAGGDEDVIAVQRVYRGEDLVTQIAQGQVAVTVWAGQASCGWYTAEGEGTLVSTDNDFYAFARPDRKNANAFGQQLEETLFAPGGDPVSVEYAHRWVFFPSGDVKEHVSIILD